MIVQAKTEARERTGMSMLDAARPLIFLALFYDKSMLSESSSRYVPKVWHNTVPNVNFSSKSGHITSRCAPEHS